VIAIVLGLVISEGIGALLAILTWPGVDTGNAAWMNRVGMVGVGLQAHVLPVFLPVASALALLIAYLSTRSWTAPQQSRALLLTALTAIPVFALLSTWSGSFGQNFAAGRARPVYVRTDAAGRFAAALYHPGGLSVTQEGDVFHVRPDVVGTVPGRYRIETRVTLNRTRDELWHHVREVDLPRYAGQLDDRFAASDLDNGYRRVMSAPGAGYGVGPNPLRCTCEFTMTFVRAESPAEESLRRHHPSETAQAAHCTFTRNVTEAALFATVSAAAH